MRNLSKLYALVLLSLVAVASACTINMPSNSNAAAPSPVPQQATPAPTATPAAVATPAPANNPAPATDSSKSTVDPCSRREQVKFKPGSDDATLNHEICSNMQREYWFKANAGQLVQATFSDKEGSGYLELYAEDGVTYFQQGVDHRVPASGTFKMIVRSVDPNQTRPFRLYLRIQ